MACSAPVRPLDMCAQSQSVSVLREQDFAGVCAGADRLDNTVPCVGRKLSDNLSRHTASGRASDSQRWRTTTCLYVRSPPTHDDRMTEGVICCFVYDTCSQVSSSMQGAMVHATASAQASLCQCA